MTMMILMMRISFRHVKYTCMPGNLGVDDDVEGEFKTSIDKQKMEMTVERLCTQGCVRMKSMWLATSIDQQPSK